MRYTSFMPALIKNCGLKTPSAIACSVATGASFIGFVHHPASPRHLEAQEIASLYAHVPPDVARVIVLVNPADATLDSLPKPDFWQITGVSTPARIAEIHTRTGVPVITAMRLATVSDLAPLAALEDVSAHILFDAFHATEAGGTGHAFDWSLLDQARPRKPWFLAGGLTPHTVADAIRRTHAPMVDVSSGIEETPGNKSLEKIAAFNAAVLQP